MSESTLCVLREANVPNAHRVFGLGSKVTNSAVHIYQGKSGSSMLIFIAIFLILKQTLETSSKQVRKEYTTSFVLKEQKGKQGVKKIKG